MTKATCPTCGATVYDTDLLYMTHQCPLSLAVATDLSQDMTDERLIKLGLVDVLVNRFGNKPFIVRRRFESGRVEFVEDVAPIGCGIEWTTDPKMARFFRGAEWVQEWATEAREGGYELLHPSAYGLNAE